MLLWSVICGGPYYPLYTSASAQIYTQMSDRRLFDLFSTLSLSPAFKKGHHVSYLCLLIIVSDRITNLIFSWLYHVVLNGANSWHILSVRDKI